MIRTVKRWIAWLQSKEPAWFQKNSWVNEGLAGFVMTGLLIYKSGSTFVAVLIFNAASYAYERWLDPSAHTPGHNPMDDMGQRAAASVLVAWLWSLL